MAFNGSGTYNLPAGNPVVTGTTISSSTTNTTNSDIATALTNCITRDGQSTPSANLPMNAKKLTGLAAGTTAGDSVRYEQVLLLAGGTMTGTVTFAAGQALPAANITGTLPIGNGGTNSTATPTAGGAGYGTGTAHAYTAAGTSGQFLTSQGASAPTWTTVSAGFTLGTPVVSTSGTSVTFTGIPAGVKQIVITFNEVSTNGTSEWKIRLGDSGGIETSGYLSQSIRLQAGVGIAAAQATDGFIILSNVASNKLSGSVTLTLENATQFRWVGAGILGSYDFEATYLNSGVKSLSAELTQVSITTQGGVDAFDAGEINIAYT